MCNYITLKDANCEKNRCIRNTVGYKAITIATQKKKKQTRFKEINGLLLREL